MQIIGRNIRIFANTTKAIGLRNIVRFSGLVIAALIMSRCAQISNPSGGPKDMAPPEVLETSPENGKPNFKENKFTIRFNEFIELDNITQKAMISPPVEELPDFKVKGKTLQVKFKEDLKPNTTYSVYFGDAIVDITERNPVLNYTYIFSTGPAVDSLSISGKVLNAFDLTPPEEVYVLLYKDNNDTLPLDSLPIAVKPYYLSKTDAGGNFQLNGLSNEPYLMFAVKDLNNNYFYDQPGEEIAFIDTLVMPQQMVQPVFDSALLEALDEEDPDYDSLRMRIDSLFADSLTRFNNSLVRHTLYLFDEVDTVMQLVKAETSAKNILRFSFNRSAESVDFQVLNYTSDTAWYLAEFSKDRDTVTWFLRNIPVDTVEVLMRYNGDTLGMEFLRTDPSRSLRGSERRRKKDEADQKEFLAFDAWPRPGRLRPDRLPEIRFAHPLANTITDSVMLVSGEDTTYNPEYFFVDSLHRIIRFPLEMEEESKFEIVIPDSTFVDWNGLFNENKSIRYSTVSLREYGVLSFLLKGDPGQEFIFQLMTDKEAIVREHYCKGETTLNLQYLDPGEYKVKVIFDDNANRRWDSGWYSSKTQPEKVIYYPKTLAIRGNWDLQEEWDLRE